MQRFEGYFRQLLLLAQLGLTGPNAQPDLARNTLTLLKEDIVTHEGGRVKNHYMKKLGAWAFVLGAVSAILGLAFRYYPESPATFSAYCFLWTACMAGVWLSFGARKPTLDSRTCISSKRIAWSR